MRGRPKSMLIFSILNFVFSGLSISWALFAIFNEQTLVHGYTGNEAPLTLLLQTSSIIHIAIGLFACLSGVGLNKMAKWGWGVTLGYSITSLVNTCTFEMFIRAATWALQHNGESINWTHHILATGIKASYPIVLIVFLNTSSWKEAFKQAKSY